MKLHEIRGKHKPKDSSDNKKTIKIDSYNYGPLKLEVTFDYEAPSSDRHGDNASFDEHHPGGIDITKIELAADLKDEESGKTWPKGTEVSKLPEWDDIDDKAVEDELHKKD